MMTTEQDAVTAALRLVEAARAQGRVVPVGAAAAVGRFQPNGPIGYRAVGRSPAPVRGTRIEAMADWCELGIGVVPA